MSDLPPGWEWAKLGELGTWFGGGTPSKSEPEYWLDGTIPWLSPKDMGFDVLVDTRDKISEVALTNSAARLVPANSIAIVIRSGILERKLPVAIVPFSTALNQDMRAIVPFSGVAPEWIAYYLRSVEYKILKDCTKRGTTVASIDVPSLMNVSIPIPPEAEQRRILAALGDHLSRVARGVATLDGISWRLNRLRDQVIAWGSTGLLLGSADLVRHSLSDVGLHDGELPLTPSTWRWVRLYEVADVVGGITKDAKKQSDVTWDEVPYLRVANVQRGWIDLSSVSTIRASKDKIEQLTLRPGDVLLNEGGDRDKLARGWVWEGQIPLCIHQNHVFRVRVRGDVLDPKIIAWHANSFGKSWAEANGKQSVNLASISLSKIRLLPIPVPPKADQSRIVSLVETQLAVIDRLIDSVAKIKKRAQLLRRAVLAEAFSGSLVAQDPGDESARVLLEHIHAELASLPKRQRMRRPKNTTQETLL